jgi:hypothetical protein
MKRVSKADAIKALNNVDTLEIIYEDISRKESATNKQSQLRRFSAEVQKQINDERDVLLIAVKVK